MRESRASFLSIRISIVRKWRERLRPRSLRASWTSPAFSISDAHADEHGLPADRAASGRDPPAPDAAARRTRRRAASPSRADDKDFTFDVNGNAVLSRQRRDAPGRPGHHAPTAWNTTRRPARAKLEGGVEFTDPQLIGARQQRRAIRRRSARSSKARSSSCRSATRAARRAACRWTPTAPSRWKACRSPPARSPTWPGR